MYMSNQNIYIYIYIYIYILYPKHYMNKKVMNFTLFIKYIMKIRYI